MQTLELTSMPISEAAERIRAREVSPVELTEAYLRRIERLNPHINAYVVVTPERAMEDARRAEAEIAAGDYKGALHGIPIALKDLYETAGIRTSGGCRAYEDNVPAEDCTVARKLREAGSVLLGKTNTHELAYGTTTNNHWYGPTRNPWAYDRIPGGSSGGSGAATVADLAAATMGTDTGGSIRIPAALCGVVGMKPTYGRVSKAGVLPMSWQLDHAGPLAKTVRDAAIMLEAVEGYDPRDGNSVRVGSVDYSNAFETDLSGVVVGVPRSYFFELLDDEVRAAVEAALATLRGLGAEVRDLALESFQDTFRVAFDMVRTEAIEFHAKRLESNPDGFSPELRAILQHPISGTAYAEAQRAMYDYRAAVRTALEDVSVLVAPTTRAPAALIGQDTVDVAGVQLPIALVMAGLTSPFNVAGTPAMSVPCGFSSGGLPIGMQIVGRPFDEWNVFRVGHAYEQATGWHTRRPAP
ncbi:MAG TPA: amidase [Tepidiformaceae bacterium]|nr:amidase [Tepidiformaceae bacterium]